MKRNHTVIGISMGRHQSTPTTPPQASRFFCLLHTNFPKNSLVKPRHSRGVGIPLPLDLPLTLGVNVSYMRWFDQYFQLGLFPILTTKFQCIGQHPFSVGVTFCTIIIEFARGKFLSFVYISILIETNQFR